ncbi:glmZ(sRNA)-inactivating NTPase, partial [Haemophilus influenzae]
HYFY